MTNETFQQIAPTIPHQPGVYKYFDESNKLIYVGKAKDLRKRVSSYFVKTQDNYKTRKLVQHIHHLEFTIVDTEQDAFLLENSLIKQFQPRYNINLKDDKSYPYVVIKNEPFPRVFLTRRVIKDGSEYIGPFTSVGKVRELLEFIRTYIPLRTCGLSLTTRLIKSGKYKVCLEYHLGNCKGPCEGLQTEEDYQKGLQQVRNILKGNITSVINRLKEEMNEHAAKLEYEKAEVIKKKIESLQDYNAKSSVVSSHIGDVDVFTIVTDGYQTYVNYLQVMNGSIIQTKTITLERRIEESNEDTLLFAIAHLREKMNSFTNEIVVPFHIEYPDNNLSITVPKAGDKKKLLDLSLKNVNYFMEEMKKKQVLKLVSRTKEDNMKILSQLQEDLQLTHLPVHIECFDNSNFQGSYPVAACIVFKDGIPSNKDYRHFNIKTVTGINDFASMSEVVYRRYKRLLDENQPLPQLVIIDGGKGQLGAAMESIEKLGLTGSMTLVGLAKNVEEIFFPEDKESLKLPFEGESLKLIRRVRDEVHRFGITFHRQKRSKGTFVNELEQINGIGKQTADQLLNKFRSVNKIKQLTERELAAEIGRAKARVIVEHFQKNQKITD